MIVKERDEGEEYYTSLFDAIKTYPTLIVIYVICFAVFGFVAKLFVYHVKIIFIGESTYSNLKGHYKNMLFNPYRKSCGKSCKCVYYF